MSNYYPSFNFLNKNSYDDYHLIVASFDGDSGESDAWLGMDPVYSDAADGTVRLDYGAKFNSVATPKITVIKSDGSDFTVAEVRQFLKWTTGSRKNSYLELCEWNFKDEKWDVKFRLLGRTTKAYQQKLDARTVGLIIEFTTVSPFAFSPVMNCKHTINGENTITIEHDNDDVDTLIYLNTKFENTNGDSLQIYNQALDETTEIKNLAVNEIVTLDSNGFIKSDKPNKIFGNDFNYVFPRFGCGADTLVVSGYGSIEFEYIYYIKMGDCTIDVAVSSGYISCGGGSTPAPDPGGDTPIVIEEISWDKVTNKPDLYTVDEVDALLLQYNSKIISITNDITNINNNITAINETINIDENELNIMLENILT